MITEDDMTNRMRYTTRALALSFISLAWACNSDPAEPASHQLPDQDPVE